MWDELEVTIPPEQDPYAIIDGIQKMVEKETAGECGQSRSGVGAGDSALPGAVGFGGCQQSTCVRPARASRSMSATSRAPTNGETRKRLYAAVVELMHGKRATVKQ